MLIGSPPGATYDIWARLVARHLGPHLPGNPAVVAQNMPGAGSTVMTNYIYNVAAQDGTFIGLMNSTNPFEPLFGVSEAKFDPLKINWLGSPAQDTAVVMVWHDVPVDTIEMAKTRAIRFAATSVNGTAAFFVRVFNAVLGTKFTLVYGYPGLSDAMLAMERGEVDGHPSPYWSYLKTAKPDWISDKKVKFLLQYGRRPNPELPDVPFARDLLTNDADRELLDAAMAQLTIGYPFFMGPGVPPDRVEAMRRAFAATFRDADFLADAKSQNLDIDPLAASEVQQTLSDTYRMPSTALDRLRRLYQPPADQK